MIELILIFIGALVGGAIGLGIGIYIGARMAFVTMYSGSIRGLGHLGSPRAH